MKVIVLGCEVSRYSHSAHGDMREERGARAPTHPKSGSLLPRVVQPEMQFRRKNPHPMHLCVRVCAVPSPRPISSEARGRRDRLETLTTSPYLSMYGRKFLLESMLLTAVLGSTAGETSFVSEKLTTPSRRPPIRTPRRPDAMQKCESEASHLPSA